MHRKYYCLKYYGSIERSTRRWGEKLVSIFIILNSTTVSKSKFTLSLWLPTRIATNRFIPILESIGSGKNHFLSSFPFCLCHRSIFYHLQGMNWIWEARQG